MIETQGKGKKLTIIVGDKIGNKLTADGRSTKQMTPIVKDLLTNLNILNAQDKLELDTPYTNKVWLDKLGEAIVYNNFGVMQQQVKSHYKRNPKYHIELNKHVETSYDQDNNITDILDYNSPIIGDVALSEQTQQIIDSKVDTVLSRVGGQFRNKSEKIVYKWTKGYRGKSLPIEVEELNAKTMQYEKIEKQYVSQLSDEQVEMYDKYLDSAKQDAKANNERFSIKVFSNTEECKDFIGENFNMEKIWQTWEISKKPQSDNSMADMEVKNLKSEMINHIVKAFAGYTFRSDNSGDPHVYRRAIEVAKWCHKDQDDSTQLLYQGDIEHIHSVDYDKVYCATDSIKEDFYHKLLGDMMLVPAFRSLVKIACDIDIDDQIFFSRIKEYQQALLKRAADDELLEMALQQQNPELFE